MSVVAVLHQPGEGERDDVLATTDRVVVLCTVAAERHGQSWSAHEVHVWRVADGKAVEFDEHQGDQ